MAAKRDTLLSPRGLAALKAGEWMSDPAARGAGRLQARRLASDEVVFYYRYTAPDGVRVRIPLGSFDAKGAEGISLAEARLKAGELSRRYQSGERDLRGALERDERERQAVVDADTRLRQAAAAREAGTLGVLVTAYVDHLDRAGKTSADAVRAMLKRHLETAHPKLWSKPAADVTPEDGVAILSTLVDAKKMREAGKLRAAMRAAYALAIRSHTDPSAPASLRELGLRANPFADLAAIAGGSNARERALSVEDLRTYWQDLAAQPEPVRSLLRFHLLTGGQRVEQLARAQVSAWDEDAETLTLLDPKGRRTTARRHVVPLLPDAVDAIGRMATDRAGPYLFTVTAGATPCSFASANQRLRDVVTALVKAKKVSVPFTLGDLRRTVETRLASLGVSREIRAQLQSHGLGGVQARHYDRHDYLAEKRDALELLRGLLETKSATVTPIRRAPARKR